jgi:hypothetical protein
VTTINDGSCISEKITIKGLGRGKSSNTQVMTGSYRVDVLGDGRCFFEIAESRDFVSYSRRFATATARTASLGSQTKNIRKY